MNDVPTGIDVPTMVVSWCAACQSWEPHFTGDHFQTGQYVDKVKPREMTRSK